MKFLEIATFVFMVMLVITLMAQFAIIPTPHDNLPYSSRTINTKNNTFNLTDDGEVVCSDSGKISDIACKVNYLETKAFYSGLKEDTNLFGFSDITRGANQFSDTLFLTTYRADDIFDYYVNDCVEYHGSECIKKNPAKKLKFLITIPLQLVYLFAFIELITGRNLTGDR